MLRFPSFLLVALVASACSKPVPIRSPYGEAPGGKVIKDLAVLTIHDMRGRRVGSASRTTTMDLPDTATTSTTYGSSYAYSTTTYDRNEVTVTTGNTLGSAFVEDVDATIGRFASSSSAFRGVRFVDIDNVLGMDDRSLGRLAKDAKVRRLAWFDLSEYEFNTDTQAKAMTWAYLGGLTLGLIVPFIPLERWNASVSVGGDVYVWEAGQGIVRRRAFDETYYQRGPGVPGYNRVLSGVSGWADTKIAEDLLEAYAELANG